MCRKRKYSLVLENHSKLNKVFSLNLSPAAIVLICSGIPLSALFLAFLLFAFTPVGNIVSRGSHSLSDIEIERYIGRIDSLQRRLDADKVYIDNIRSLMDPSRPVRSDSLTAALPPLSSELLTPVSKRERNFVARISAAQRKSGRLLASDPARTLAFTSPVDVAVMDKESANSGIARFRITSDADIYAIADGRVVEKYYSASGDGFVILVQHPKGFISRYTSPGNPLVDIGDWVSAGQAMIVPSGISSHGYLLLEIWHDGDRLIPEDFLDSYFFSSNI